MRYCSLERMRKTLNSVFIRITKKCAIKIINFQGQFKRDCRLSQQICGRTIKEFTMRDSINRRIKTYQKPHLS